MSDPLHQTLMCTLKGKTLAYIVNVIPIMSERVILRYPPKYRRSFEPDPQGPGQARRPEPLCRSEHGERPGKASIKSVKERLGESYLY